MIQEIERLGGRVYLDFGDEYEAAMDDAPERGGQGATPMKPWPEWLRNSIGEDFLFYVRDVLLNGKPNLRDSDLVVLSNLDRARALYLHYSSVTDFGFRQAQNLKGLEVLELGHTQVTENSLAVIEDFTGLISLSLRRHKPQR